MGAAVRQKHSSHGSAGDTHRRPTARRAHRLTSAAMARLAVALDYRPAMLSSAGIGRAVRELARALARRHDLETHLFAHSWAGVRRPDPPPDGARLHRRRLPGRALPALARFGVDAARLAGGCRVFHWTDYIHPPVRRAVAVLTVHDLAFAEDRRFHGRQSALLLERTRRAAARARIVLTPTRATADAVLRHLAIPETRVRVIPFGVDHVQPSARTAAPGDVRPVVMVGTIEPRKNHDNVLRAWRQMTAAPPLEIIGAPGWECEAIVGALRAAHSSGQLRWRCGLDDAETFAAIAGARALLYPSALEGFGFPPLEAMALGVPVIAADIPALRETLGDAAWYCDGSDPRSIAAAVQRVDADAAERRARCRRGIERARQLRWDRCAAAHAAVYRAAAAHEAIEAGA